MTLLETLIEQKWSLLAAVIAVYAARSFLRYHRLRQFGGPWGTGFSKIPHNINVFTGEAHHWYRGISEQYGTSPVTA